MQTQLFSWVAQGSCHGLSEPVPRGKGMPLHGKDRQGHVGDELERQRVPGSGCGGLGAWLVCSQGYLPL